MITKHNYTPKQQKYLLEYAMKNDITNKKEIKIVAKHFIELCEHNYNYFKNYNDAIPEEYNIIRFRSIDYLDDNDYDLYCNLMKTIIEKGGGN
jgi:hypothetical protein